MDEFIHLTIIFVINCIYDCTIWGFHPLGKPAKLTAQYLILNRSATVFVEGAENFVIRNCTFDSPGGKALMLSNYIRNSVVEANEFVWVGDSAIVLLGSTNLIDGTSGDQPRGTTILGNGCSQE